MKKIFLFACMFVSFAISNTSEDVVQSIANKVNSRWKECMVHGEGDALVKIFIDKHARFSYEILNLSGNLEFQNELKACLNGLKNEVFPKKPNNRETILKLKLENKVTQI